MRGALIGLICYILSMKQSVTLIGLSRLTWFVLGSINQSIEIVIFKRSNYSALGILKRCYLRRLLQIDGPSGVTISAQFSTPCHTSSIVSKAVSPTSLEIEPSSVAEILAILE
jgi:hypothetical protein